MNIVRCLFIYAIFSYSIFNLLLYISCLCIFLLFSFCRLNDVPEIMVDQLLCYDFWNSVQDKRFIVLQGFRPIMDTLFHNPYHKQKLEDAGFGNSENGSYFLVKAVGRCLLAPSKEVREMLERFNDTNTRSSFQQTVGIRIYHHVVFPLIFSFLLFFET